MPDRLMRVSSPITPTNANAYRATVTGEILEKKDRALPEKLLPSGRFRPEWRGGDVLELDP
jgi:hypothetical protein